MNTGLLVDHCIFDDMQMVDDGLGNLDFSGYGIHAVGNANVDFTLDHKNVFSNSARGVYAEGFEHANVFDNAFDNIAVTNEIGGVDNYGFGVELRANGWADVADNHIVDCELGISMLDFPNGDRAYVHANRISQTTGNTYRNGTGIYASSHYGQIRIHWHNEEAQQDGDDGFIRHMRYGIVCNDVHYAGIFYNDIHFKTDNDLEAIGVEVINTSKTDIVENDIKGHGDLGDIGVKSQGCANVSVVCNDIGNVNVGIHRLGESGLYKVVGNRFWNDQHISLWVRQSSFPNQIDGLHPSDNRWLDGYDFTYHTYSDLPPTIPGKIIVRPLPNPSTILALEYNPTITYSGGSDGVYQQPIPLQNANSGYNEVSAMLNTVDSLRFREWVSECEYPIIVEEARRGQDEPDQVKQIQSHESGVFISAYPNPIDGMGLLIEINQLNQVAVSHFQYQIYSTTGALFSSGLLKAGRNHIGSNGFSSGLNLIRVTDSTGSVVANFKITFVE